MKEKVEIRIAELTRRAKEGGGKASHSASQSSSSLHQVIKTKKQAAAFMKLLRSV